MSKGRMEMLECYAARYWRVGGSWGVILPPDIREYFGLRPGELMLVSIDYNQGVIVMRQARANSVFDPSRRLKVPSPIVTEAPDANS